MSLGHISSWTCGLGDVCKTSRWPSLGHPAILNKHVPLIPPKNFPSTLMSFEELYDGLHGSHFGYLNGKITANIHVPLMPPIKQNSMVKNLGSNNRTMLYPNPCYNKVCYKGQHRNVFKEGNASLYLYEISP